MHFCEILELLIRELVIEPSACSTDSELLLWSALFETAACRTAFELLVSYTAIIPLLTSIYEPLLQISLLPALPDLSCQSAPADAPTLSEPPGRPPGAMIAHHRASSEPPGRPPGPFIAQHREAANAACSFARCLHHDPAVLACC